MKLWPGKHTALTSRMRILGLVLLLGLSLPVRGASLPDAGTNNPFELGAGSRALSLGSGFTAVADDVSALFWNPAGLAQLDQIEIMAMHISLFFDTPYDFLGVAYPLLEWGTFSAGVVRLGSSGIVVRDERSRILEDRGNFDLREFLLGFSREVASGVDAGLVMKIDQARLLGDFDMGLGLDAGVHYRLPKQLLGPGGMEWDRFTAGLSLQNLLGSQMRLKEVADHLPMNLRLGLAYSYATRDSLQQRMVINAGMEKSTWRAIRFSVGGEYGLWKMFFLRASLGQEVWTAGAGLEFSGINLDYALTGEELGMTHRFTLGYRFGTSLQVQKQFQAQRKQQALEKEASNRAKAEVDKAQKKMDAVLQAIEQKHRRETQAMLSDRDRLLKAEREKQLEQQKAAVADEYFKALHYFQGIKDFIGKQYKSALLEFQTVEKFDPNYLELKNYLALTRQRLQGGEIQFLNSASMQLYYQGIDLYIAEKFTEAIGIWKKILEQEPNNTLVQRNIDEAQERITKINRVQKPSDDGAENRPGVQPPGDKP